METYHLTSAQGNVTGEHRQVEYMRIEDEAARMNQFWLFAFVVVVMAVTFVYLARDLGQLPDSFSIGAREIAIRILVILATG